jgi:ATP-dependent RNA helicase DeaD
VTALPIYGGASMENQCACSSAASTSSSRLPGRALDHIRRKTLRLDSVKVVVLDEADEMLDMGFAEDLEAILQATPKERQTALFSATLPQRIAQLAEQHLKDPVRVRIDREVLPAGSAPRVRQVAYIVARAHKIATLGRVLDVENPTVRHRVLSHAHGGRRADGIAEPAAAIAPRRCTVGSARSSATA